MSTVLSTQYFIGGESMWTYKGMTRELEFGAIKELFEEKRETEEEPTYKRSFSLQYK